MVQMATRATAEKNADSVQKQAGELRYVARQPILDLGGKAHGYELLFWNGREPIGRPQGDMATRTMLDNTILFGLEKLSRGLPAFVNCTAESVTSEWVKVLPPRMTVLELSAAEDPSEELLTACHALKASGFRLALAGFSGESECGPLAGLADYIKVEIDRVRGPERQKMLRRLGGAQARLVAQNVETQEQYGIACKEGFDLFQGYYFCRPEPLESHKIPGNRLVHLEIMEDLQNDPVDLRRLSQLVMCDASLAYRLLRLVNSPVCAMRQEVTSIQSALMLVGESAFRRMAMLAIATDFSTDQPDGDSAHGSRTGALLRVGRRSVRTGSERAISHWPGQFVSRDAAHSDGGSGPDAALARGGSRGLAGRGCSGGRSAALDRLPGARRLEGVRRNRPLQRPEPRAAHALPRRRRHMGGGGIQIRRLRSSTMPKF